MFGHKPLIPLVSAGADWLGRSVREYQHLPNGAGPDGMDGQAIG